MSAKDDGLHGSNPLAKKLNKILETRFDNDKELLESLRSLSQYFSENSLRNRRDLRGNIERRSLNINEEFVSAFTSVVKQLDDVHASVQAVSECSEEMTSRLKKVKEQTQDLISRTTQLQEESQNLELRTRLVDAFLARFQLTNEQLQVLRQEIITQDFFDVLSRCQSIHSDCKILLRTNQQTAGLEIMESMALNMETAYERLYRWTQGQCRLMTADPPDVNPLLSRALQHLQQRPVLFKYTMDELATARRTAVVRGFIDALTRPGSGGLPRPMELHSHEPVRYVGDMLAWVHQAVASETELLTSLLKNSLNLNILECLGHITEGLTRPLRTRIEQVLTNDCVTAFRIRNLLAFYYTTLQPLLPGGCSLLESLLDLGHLFDQHFTTLLHPLLADSAPPASLAPPPALQTALNLLAELLAAQPDTEVVGRVLGQVLGGQVGATGAELVYRINCLSYVINNIGVYERTEDILKKYQSELDSLEVMLVKEILNSLLQSTGLDGARQRSDFSDDYLRTLSLRLDSLLTTSAVLPECTLIQQPRLRARVQSRALEELCNVYEEFYNKVKDSNTVGLRDPQQLKQLLV